MERYNDTFREEFRHGSARWVTQGELSRAGLLSSSGPQLGYWKSAYSTTPVRLESDASIITIAGAGSGKMRDLLGYVLCNTPDQRMLVLDPRGEGAAISGHVHAPNGEPAFNFNPARMPFLPHHACNPLDVLKPDSPTFHADATFILEALIAITGSDNGKFFEERARAWATAITIDETEAEGGISLPSLKRALDTIESDSNAWAARLERMLASRHANVRRTAAEMLTKQQDSPREFGSVMSTIYNGFSFLDDPVLMASLENPDFSLAELTNPTRSSKIFLNIPADFLMQWSPLVRLFFTVSMLYKSRTPSSPRVLLLVDEAGQLGRFDALLRAFTFGRGMGVRAWALFQDIGQIERNYGAPAVQSFLGSAQTRQFFGVRDFATAKLVSDMLGTETREYNDEPRQQEARHQKDAAFRAIFEEDADPFDAARDYAHYERKELYRTKQSRPLMTPEEVLALPEDRQVLFVSGKNLPPILAWKYPYYTRREMAGLYLNNPYHPPADKVRVRGLLMSHWADIVTEPVPKNYAPFPQHQDGVRRYVQGYRL
ncbi:type IV secretory system conjugative DNA transfer family protein [Nisaea nitritireducens]|uniref:type IV secretory system conjugative DNA transfer family protein n=1 Tax=Nisaea nitritireducens TaxID=568392 RepID=UPI0018692635|nr:type IV secretory system conjugative DNA transfer family protein [Nisaea nitritireducens]